MVIHDESVSISVRIEQSNKNNKQKQYQKKNIFLQAIISGITTDLETFYKFDGKDCSFSLTYFISSKFLSTKV